MQTPTLALVAQREKERQAFVPEDYWVIHAQMATASGEEFKATHATARFKEQPPRSGPSRQHAPPARAG